MSDLALRIQCRRMLQYSVDEIRPAMQDIASVNKVIKRELFVSLLHILILPFILFKGLLERRLRYTGKGLDSESLTEYR